MATAKVWCALGSAATAQRVLASTSSSAFPPLRHGDFALRANARFTPLGWISERPCGKDLPPLSRTCATAREAVGFSDGGGDGRGGGRGRGYGGSDDDGDFDGDAANVSPSLGAGFWLWYNSVLESHPLITKSLTAGFLNVIADLFCQVFIEKLDDVNIKRLMSFVAIGVFMSGPGLHYWYGVLPKLVTHPGAGGVMLRIALDQLLFTPVGMLTYFVVLLTLEGRRGEIMTKLEQDLCPTIVTNWKVWVPFQVLNFGMIPPQLQVGASSILGMVWSVFISYKGHT